MSFLQKGKEKGRIFNEFGNLRKGSDISRLKNWSESRGRIWEIYSILQGMWEWGGRMSAKNLNEITGKNWNEMMKL